MKAYIIAVLCLSFITLGAYRVINIVKLDDSDKIRAQIIGIVLELAVYITAINFTLKL